MREFCFTVDDNIRFPEELTRGDYESLLSHPYLAMYRRLHERFGLRVQLNLFYRSETFDLSQMTDRFRDEWAANADWLRLSFHSELENVRPYENADYPTVMAHCRAVHREILRFASPASLARTTTIHYCRATEEGLRAMRDNGVRGLLGLYGSDETPRVSYQSTPEECARLRRGETVCTGGMTYAAIDVVLNQFPIAEILSQLASLRGREAIRVMIHEQYFYPDYRYYQREFEEKLNATFSYLAENGYRSVFFEEQL